MVRNYLILVLALGVLADFMPFILPGETIPVPLPPEKNFSPVLGILSLPIDPYEDFNVDGNTYIAGSYVKFLEMAGARVVPIRIDQPFTDIEYLFWQLNGVLFTGGSANMWKSNSTAGPNPPLSIEYAEKACFLYNLVKKANDQGIHMPLWGTCLGFEVLHICANNQYATLGHFNGEPPYAQLTSFTDAAISSRIFSSEDSNWSLKVMNDMVSEPIALLSHEHGISPATYSEFKNLSDTFTILSTMRDKSGKTFVGMIEAKKYPIYGSQFHPEKNLYEWNTATIPHSPEAVSMAAFFANFIVSEARRNVNQFLIPAVLRKNLIYNWPLFFLDKYFETIYTFN